MNRKEFIEVIKKLRQRHIKYEIQAHVETPSMESHRFEIRFVFPESVNYKDLPQEVWKLPYGKDGDSFEHSRTVQNTRVIYSRFCNRKFAQHYIEYERVTKQKAEEMLQKYLRWEKKAITKLQSAA